MKKNLLSLLLALSITAGCLSIPAYAETTATDETEDPAMTETLPDLAQDAQAPQTEYAFGSVSILNGCRTLDGQVPLAGSDRKLDTAQAAIIYERNTGTLVYAYNPDTKLPPGALSKIVTALIVVERVENLDTVVTVQPGIASRIPGGATSTKLKSEEQMSVKDLLHCMIMQNAADAAVALAEYVAGTRATFVDMMNQRVKQLGCTSTEFTDVHGVGSGNQTTTARDMVRIMMACSDNPAVKELLSTQTYEVPATNLSEKRKLQSLDYMMQNKIVTKYIDDRVTSGFASYSADTGASIVVTADNTETAGVTGMNLVCVIMGATRVFASNGWQVTSYGNFDEMVKLLGYAYNNFLVHRVIYNGMSLTQLPVAGGETNVVGVANVNVDTVLPSKARMANLIRNVSARDGGLSAPIEKDSVIGTVELWYSNSCLTEAQLLAQQPVRTAADSGLTVYSALAPQTQSERSSLSGVVLIVCAVILVPVVSYLAINSYLRYRAQTRRRKKEPEKESVMETWEELEEKCLHCDRCELCRTRHNVVFGVGNRSSRLLFVGEGPGEQEDLQGIPFVGPAGKLLDDMLSIIDLDREKCYIANIVKCRPPRNRDPQPQEQDACIGFLEDQIALLQPKIIVCLGRIAAQRLIAPEFRITRDHGTWTARDGVLYSAMYHPSALLRDPTKRPETFDDLLLLRKKIQELNI